MRINTGGARGELPAAGRPRPTADTPELRPSSLPARQGLPEPDSGDPCSTLALGECGCPDLWPHGACCWDRPAQRQSGGLLTTEPICSSSQGHYCVRDHRRRTRAPPTVPAFILILRRNPAGRLEQPHLYPKAEAGNKRHWRGFDPKTFFPKI